MSKNQIDEIIAYQTEDIEKCCSFIEWKYLGTKNYLDVFGAEAERQRAERRTLEALQDTVNKLQAEIARLHTIQKNVQQETVNNYIKTPKKSA